MHVFVPVLTWVLHAGLQSPSQVVQFCITCFQYNFSAIYLVRVAVPAVNLCVPCAVTAVSAAVFFCFWTEGPRLTKLHLMSASVVSAVLVLFWYMYPKYTNEETVVQLLLSRVFFCMLVAYFCPFCRFWLKFLWSRHDEAVHEPTLVCLVTAKLVGPAGEM